MAGDLTQPFTFIRGINTSMHDPQGQALTLSLICLKWTSRFLISKHLLQNFMTVQDVQSPFWLTMPAQPVCLSELNSAYRMLIIDISLMSVSLNIPAIQT